MIAASELKEGMVVRIEGRAFRVIEVEARAAAAKMGGTVRARLSNVRSGRLWDQHFRPQERLDDVQVDRNEMQFLYGDENSCTFLRLSSFEQVEFPSSLLGQARRLLQPGTEVRGEFFEGELIHVTLPRTVDLRVISTAPPRPSQQESGRKEATLENGMTIQVPLFIAPDEKVTVDVATGRYVERIREVHRKGA